jgi:hypothetical protein
MRLSELLILGDVLKKRNPGAFVSSDGCSGCALGGAFLAQGGTVGEASYPTSVYKTWPWLTIKQRTTIGGMYSMKMSIEAIADYVRTIEPPEPLVQDSTEILEVNSQKETASN